MIPALRRLTQEIKSSRPAWITYQDPDSMKQKATSPTRAKDVRM
jgi:hypothetical protein